MKPFFLFIGVLVGILITSFFGYSIECLAATVAVGIMINAYYVAENKECQ